MSPSELEQLARELVAPLGLGDTLADGFVLASIGAELALGYELVRGDARVGLEVVPRAGARGEPVHTAHFAVGHRDGTLSPAHALALCRALAERVAANEVDALARAQTSNERIREVSSARALFPSGPSTAPYYALSPYRGCTIGCRFCYAQSRLQPLRGLGGAAAPPWGSWVDAHVGMPEVLADELTRLPVRPIKLCPIVADPYQAIEAKLRITRRCIEVLAAQPQPWPTLVLTRSTLLLDDLPQWSRLPQAWVGVSLPTVDDAVRRHFEPRAASVAERLALLRRCRDAGVRTFAVVQPLLPGDVDALAEALTGATSGVAIGPLEGEEEAGALFDAYAHARTAAWQQAQAARLREALAARGVSVWAGELPPDLPAMGGPT